MGAGLAVSLALSLDPRTALLGMGTSCIGFMGRVFAQSGKEARMGGGSFCG